MDFNIVCDENIPLAKEAFSEFGEVETLPGRDINSDILKTKDILLVRSVTKVDKELLSDSQVKFVGSATTGIDHVNKEYLEEKSIGFANAAGANARSVAEYTIASVLFSLKKMGKRSDEAVLGVVGVGSIGSEVVKLAGQFGIDCMFCDPPKKEKTKSDIYRNLYDVLAASDVVTVHVPLVRSGEYPTGNMIDDTFLNGMKSGASLINTSRGEVVDENALLENRRRLSSLVLDVWKNEPEINRDLLETADIATSHIAGYSKRAKLRGTVFLHKSLSAFFFHKPEWDYESIEFPKKVFDPSPDDSAEDIIIKFSQIEELTAKLKQAENQEEPFGSLFDRLRAECIDKPEFKDCELPDDWNDNSSYELIEKLRKTTYSDI